MLEVAHDKIILLSPPFQPSQCWLQIVAVMLICSMLEINDHVVLYCIVLYCKNASARFVSTCYIWDLVRL